MHIVVRNATEADTDALFEIRISASQTLLSLAQISELGISSSMLKAPVNQHPCAWIAEVNGEPCAFAIVCVESGEVFALFIKPDYEDLNLGQLLMSAAEDSQSVLDAWSDLQLRSA